MTGVRVSVVVPTLGRPGVLRTALEHVAACDPPPHEVIVVDGDPGRSSEPAMAAVMKLPNRYLLSRRGLTLQRNRGLEAVTGDVVLFIDDDSRVPPDVVSRLVRCYEDPSVVAATGHVVEPGGPRIGGKSSRVRRLLPGGGREGAFTRFGYPRRIVDTSTPRDVEFMQGAFMSARIEDARATGFDERLGSYALAEDEDFACRLARRGRIVYDPTIVVHHDNLGFSSRNRRQFGRMVVVNRWYLFRKNFPQTPWAIAQFAMLIGVLLVHRVLNRDVDGARGLLEGVVAAVRGEP